MGADGLSKKERRALKVAQKGDNVNQVEVVKSLTNTGGSTRNLQQIPNKAAVAVDKQAQKLNTKQSSVETKNNVIEKKQQTTPDSVGDKSINAVPDVTPSKAQLRAERRALQEQQRLAKAQENTEKPEKNAKESPKPPPVKTPAKKIETKPDVQNEHRVYLFNHLYFNSSIIGDNQEQITDLHSSFIRLGVQYSSKTVLGSNARCLALLSALREFVIDFSPPTNQEFCRAVETYLQKNTLYLHKCRPFAVSMTNALKHFKVCLTQIDTNLSDADKKERLLDIIDTYKQEQIEKAGEAISLKVNEKITNKDVILTYGW